MKDRFILSFWNDIQDCPGFDSFKEISVDIGHNFEDEKQHSQHKYSYVYSS